MCIQTMGMPLGILSYQMHIYLPALQDEQYLFAQETVKRPAKSPKLALENLR